LLEYNLINFIIKFRKHCQANLLQANLLHLISRIDLTCTPVWIIKGELEMKLFEPGKIGKLSVKNRIIMAPMGIGALAEPDGRLSQRAIDYYVARAKGGVGLIITGVTCVDTEIEKKTDEGGLGMMARADSAIHINRLTELVDAVHDYGATLCVQLTAGMGRVAFGDILRKGHAVAPSASPCFWNPGVTSRELTTEEVEKLVQAFGRAAVFLRTANVDAIELHGHEGYLLDQFQSALWNRRTDRYGGDLEGRLRFPLEVIKTIKSRLGIDFPIIYRYGIQHHVEGGRGIDESLKMARRFEEAGVDALHVDAGCYEAWYWAHPPVYQPRGCMIDIAEKIVKEVNIPVIAVGKLGYPEIAEKVLQEEKADFIALGRALLADPEWPLKVQAERFDDIRPCIGDHAGCLTRIFQGKYIGCAVNPATGMEREFTLQPAKRRRPVLIIGGGPAGMQAAMVAAQRGHEVSLWEKDGQLGGKLIPASAPEFKKDLRDLIKYLSTQVKKLRVDIILEREASLKLVQETKPEVVIVATGATPIMPQIPGMEKDKVLSAVDLLLGKKQTGEKVLVLGGGLIGCETAAYLAQAGKRVSVVEILKHVFRGENRANEQQMLKMLEDGNVNVLTNTSVLEITDEGAIIDHDRGQEEIEADTIVVAVGLEVKSRLQDELEGKIPEVYAIGDCVKPRRVLEAIWEGFRIARLL
jgi:2-enoate reductase